MGTLCYNEIVVIPWKPLSYNTKREIAKRENKDKGILDHETYMASSPHSGDHLSKVRASMRKDNNEITMETDPINKSHTSVK
jgi:hypothetical protein